ncbi:MAG: iron-sulfur cluster assembly protein [Anaerolineales bacterium]|jgi:metal-sulfur cluster biosynthetic enzyme
MSTESPANPIHWDIHDTHPELVTPLRAKLAEVVDPEIALNVIQLGLIRQVSITDKEARLTVLLTTPFCPYGPAMLEVIKEKATEALNMPVTLELGAGYWDFSLMEDPGALDWGMYV